MDIAGRIAEIDLTTGKWSTAAFPAAAVARIIGGRGFNVDYLGDHLTAGAAPLDPEVPLLISCGLLTGTPAPTSARIHINSLSPQTGLMGSSNVGGYFGARLRAVGIQSLVIRGRAPHPVYLYVGHQGIEIRSAQSLWGRDTVETQKQLERMLGDRIQVLSIGPAGENQVPFACVITDRDHAAGRTGMGAVMGSKNLKALVVPPPVKGESQPTSATTKAAARHYVSRVKDSSAYKDFSQYGGAGHVRWANEMGLMPTRNYREKRFAGIDGIDGHQLKAHWVRSRGCFRCPVQCKAELHFKSGKYAGFHGHRPEFEPVMILGAKCGLDDIETVVHLDNLCSRLGLDSLSAGSVIAFAMDLFQQGILTTADTGGLALGWGDGDVMATLITDMAHRRGFGALLSRGVKQAAETIGRGSHGYAAHVKGLELTAYHPGSLMGTALGYAVSPRGGDFVYASMEYAWSAKRAAAEFGTPAAADGQSPEGKGQIVRRAILVNIALDCLGLCRVPALSCIGAFDLQHEADLAAAVTGLSISAPALFRAAERIAVLERLFNLRRGLQPRDDRLPPMFLKGRAGGVDPQALDRMIAEYYHVMGWDERGVPTAAKLDELQIPRGMLPAPQGTG